MNNIEPPRNLTLYQAVIQSKKRVPCCFIPLPHYPPPLSGSAWPRDHWIWGEIIRLLRTKIHSSWLGLSAKSANVKSVRYSRNRPLIGQCLYSLRCCTLQLSIPGCPPGLEYLAQIDQVVIKQEVSLLEVLADFECPNKYRMFNSMGQQIYYVFEESGCCDRYWCGPMRGFIFHITDNNQQEVLRLVRKLYVCKGCYCCACESCRYFATVEDRTGNVLGYISDMYFCCSPRLAIYDNRMEFVAEINGPCCPCQAVCCTDDVDFPITDVRDGKYWGKITKQWSGLLKEVLTDADNYSVTFPIDLDVNKKALMIAAAFYTDMVVFETQKNNNN